MNTHKAEAILMNTHKVCLVLHKNIPSVVCIHNF